MSDSNDSIITGKLKGMLGKELVVREWDSKTVLAKISGPADAAEATEARLRKAPGRVHATPRQAIKLPVVFSRFATAGL